MIDEVAALLYRARSGAVPYLVLKRLGIATPRRRPEFRTLDALIGAMPEVPGAILECGTYRGATLLGMAHLLRRRRLKPRIYALDSFEGFPEPSASDAHANGAFHPEVHKGALGDTSYDDLLARIAQLGWSDWITVIKGYFEDTLPRLADQRFSLVHLDCDLYQSYLTCLEFCYPRMLPGGLIVLDEYRLDQDLYPGADRAVDEFFASRPEKPERLPGPDGTRSFVRIGARPTY